MAIPESGNDLIENSLLVSPHPRQQKRIIKELSDHAESNLNEGQLYYVLSNRWFTSWEKYTAQDDDHAMGENSLELPDSRSDTPGPIDNSDLVSGANDGEGGNLELIRTLQEGRDYVLVHEEVWKKLFEWYKGGPPLPRKMISQGIIFKKFCVEVYPLCLQLLDSRDNSQSVIRLSKKASVRELYEKVCALKGLEHDKACLWDYFNKRKQCMLVPSDQKLEDAHLQMDQHIFLEMQASARAASGIGVGSSGNELALVPMEPSRSSMAIGGGPSLSNGFSSGYSSKSYPGLSSMSTDVDDGYDSITNVRKKEGGGLAGLQNLGNTCFMNSALQCLFHTAPLAEYFLQKYSNEINKQNPLGMHGELAIAFGDLLRNMWSAGRTSIAPRVFKGKLARFAPQFSGYNQHDSQELLAFLLDGLHEDLNRVKQKPYIEMKDADGRPDEEYANECWKNHKARNDSIIVDTCQGQFKSTLVCPVCSKISVTFDPFMYLTLPIPPSVNRTMTVTVFYGDGNGLPMPFTVTVPKHGNYRDLIQALGTACCLRNYEGILLAQVYDHQIYRWLEIPSEPLSSINDDEHIVAYRVPLKQAGLKKLEIFHRSSEMKLLGTPFVTYLEEECASVTDIDIAIKKILSPIRKTHVALSKLPCEKQNGCAPHDGNEVENMVLNNDADTMCCSQLPFQLSLTEENGSSGSPIEDNVIKNSSMLRVTLNWTDKEHELYDISCLENLPEVCKSGFTAKKTRQEVVSLFSCLEAFLKEEPLGPADMWYCPSCKEHRQATKKLDLWRLPEILVIHLKRFSYSRYLKNKLDTFVDFHIHDLDLRKYVKCQDAYGISYTYELYAISNHYGGLGGGHYTAYAKLIDDERWYHFDDSHVSPVSESEIRTSAAYVLFYRRVKSDAKPYNGESSLEHDDYESVNLLG